MPGFDFSSIVFLILIGITVLMFVSFAFVIRSLYIQASAKRKKSDEIGKKLDNIIALLEKEKL